MTVTLAASEAALKVLYPKGEMPKSINESFKTYKELKKETDFVGELAYIALQNASSQGSSSNFQRAQADVQQGNYVRFALERVRHYGIARVDGETAEAAVKSEGALVDLWDNETKGAAFTETQCLAIYLFGNGDGVLAGISSGSGTTTLTLVATANMNYFELGMTLKAVTTTGLGSTVRSGTNKVTGIDRRNRTLTAATVWSTAITSLADTDFLVRDSDHHSAGVAAVITGLDEYVAGTTTPGTLWGLNRNSDPLKLAGQSIDYAGWAMEDAVVDASAQAGFHGIGKPNVLVCNNMEVATMKKSMSSKIVYNRPGGKEGSYSFSDITIEGESGPIRVLADPYCPRNKAWLLNMEQFSLFSLKAAPHVAQLDGNRILRLTDADSYEIRFAFYGNLKCKNPGMHVKLTNFGL